MLHLLPSSIPKGPSHRWHVGQKRKGMFSLESMLSYFNFLSISCTLRVINRHSLDFFKAAASGKCSLCLRKGLVSGEENQSWRLWVESGGRSSQFSDSILLLGPCRELVKWKLTSFYFFNLAILPKHSEKGNSITSHDSPGFGRKMSSSWTSPVVEFTLRQHSVLN